MANDVSIFKQGGAVSTASRREPSELAKSLAASNTSRRIQTNTNGTFRRIVNGEQVGDAVRGSINVIIVHALSKVSRIYYAQDYDPDAKPTLPNCWSNLGDKPEASAGDPQDSTCVSCPQNVDGSGSKGKGRACRFQRRVAILLEDDLSGDVYQFNIPAKSLFGKGTGNTHPFESYHRYLSANNESIDTVLTQVSYNLNADSMELQFTPLRGLNDEEIDLVEQVQVRPETKQAVILTVAARDGVTATPAKDKEVDEPVRRAATVKATATSAEGRSSLAAAVAAFGNSEG
jgi:hypothetical protein